MRLLYATAAEFPSRQANTVNVSKMCDAFQANGAETTLLAAGWPRLNAGKTVERYYDLSRPLRLWTVGVPHPHYRWASLIAACSAALIRADVVYTRDPRIAAFLSRSGFPVALELHHDVESFGPKARAAFAQLAAGRRAVLFVTISHAIAESIGERHPNARGRILVAHDGADPVEGDTSPPGRQPRERLKIGYVGHLYPGKGMEIIEALTPLCPWADFEIVGGRPEDVQLWRERTADAPNLTFHGAVPHAEVNARLAGFDVVLAPYLREVIVSDGRTDVAKWMSPLKIFEYMAAGKAIVTSDLPVLREVLDDGETALLCDPDTPSDWARALERLRDDANARRDLGTTAQAVFLSRYTWSQRARAILAAVTELGVRSSQD